MFLKLCRVYLKDYSFGRMFQINGSKTKKILLGIALAYVAIIVFGSLGFMFFNLAEVLNDMNQLQVMVGFLAVYALVIPIMMTLFRASGTLFFYKDHDIVAPLPIKSYVIFSAKLFVMMIWMYVFNLIIVLPILFSYFYFLGFDIIGLLMYIIAFILFPMIPIAVMSLLSLGIGFIATKFNFGKAIQIVSLFIVFFGILFLQFSINSTTQNPLTGQIDVISGLSDYYIPLRWFVDAVYDHDILSILYLIFSHVLVFALFIFMMSKISYRLNIKGIQKHHIKSNKTTHIKKSSVTKTLIKKEINKFFSIPIYVLNVGFGPILLLGAAIASIFVDVSTYVEILDMAQIDAYVILALGYGFIITLLYTTGISLSLEGKNFWVIKSLPIKAKDVMLSKIYFNMLLGIPVIMISSIIFHFTLDITAIHTILLLLISFSSLTLISFIGSVINLYFPKLDFKNEVEVIKQSLGAFLAMIAGFSVIGTQVFLFIFLNDYLSTEVIFLCLSALDSLLVIPFYVMINKNSENIFKKL